MTSLIIGTIISLVLLIGWFILRTAENKWKAGVDAKRLEVKDEYSKAEVARWEQRQAFSVPHTGLIRKGLITAAVFAFSVGFFNGAFFYAEPTYNYHVRTIGGTEKFPMGSTGYQAHWFGRYKPWKRNMSVLAGGLSDNGDDNLTDTSEDKVSAQIPAEKVIFLDQVDADVSATARFRLPMDEEGFKKVVHEFRTPENLLRSSIVPVFREVIQATPSLMSAEEYFSGSRTEFNSEFQNQIKNGIYIVRRIETVEDDPTNTNKASANASLEEDQKDYGDGKKVVFKVEKRLDANLQPLRNDVPFKEYGIEVVDARVMHVDPNDEFQTRMKQKQQASADRAVARERRMQEEEQKLFAVAKGQREQAEKQAAALVDQVQKTTDAETDKQLAITKAEQFKEQAEIDKETAQIKLEQSRLDAERQRTLADAEAYEREVILAADNALSQKLETEKYIQDRWATAYEKRNVPAQVWNMGGEGSVPVGGDMEIRAFMQMMTMQAAEALNYNRDINKK